MHWQYTPYLYPLFIAAAISAALASLTWGRRQAFAALPFVLLMLAVSVWSLSYALELAAGDLAVKITWAKVEYFGIVTLPLAWLIFSLHYAGRERYLRFLHQVPLMAIPFLTLVLVWTNEYHGLIWSETRLDTSPGFAVLVVSHGWWFWVNAAASYLYLLAGSVLLLGTLLRSHRLYRGQLFALLAAILLPWVGNGLYLSGLNPFPHLDLTPFTFALAGLLIAWGLFRFRLLEIVPIARSALIEHMQDGVLVLDPQDRIVDINPAALRILGLDNGAYLGKNVREAISTWPEGTAEDQEIKTEVTIPIGLEQVHYELHISPLHNRQDHFTGSLAIFHDVAERKNAAEMIRGEQEISARRSIQLSAVAQVAREAASIRDLDTLLVQTAQLISARFDFYHTGIFLLDAQREYVFLRAASSPGGQHMLARQHKLKIAHNDTGSNSSVPVGIVGTVAQAGEPRVALDVGKDAVFFDNPDLPETRSELAMPLKSRGQLIGVLDVQSTVPAAFANEDVEVLQVLSDQIALAIDNTRLLQESQEALRELERLFARQVGQSWRHRLANSSLAFAYDRIGIKEASSSPALFEQEDGFKLEAPLNLRGVRIGSLCLHRENEAGDWTPEELDFISQALSQTALALENARLLEETKLHAEHERLIHEIASRMRETLDLDTILQTAASEMRRALDLAEVELYLVPPSLASQPVLPGEQE